MSRKLPILLFTLIFSCLATLILADEIEDKFNQMIAYEDDTKNEFTDFIAVIENQKVKQTLSNTVKNTDKLFEGFINQTIELTADIQDPTEVFKQKIKLSEAFEILLDKRFLAVEDKLKKVNTLEAYRYAWFERAIYIYLKAKLMSFNFYISMKANQTAKLTAYYKTFEKYILDLFDFISQNKELYKKNSIYMKKTILIQDNSVGDYSSQESFVQGDLDLLLEFLKGKFKDYQGLFVNFATFSQSEISNAKDNGLVLFMNYQPIATDVKITDIQDIQVTVTGDNLEDILTYTLNEASSILNMKINSDKKMETLSTENINYKKFTQESLSLSKVAILRAKLISKKEIQKQKKQGEEGYVDPNKKTLEVTISLKVGFIKK